MMKRLLILMTILFGSASAYSAGDIKTLGALNAQEFANFSKDLASVLSYRSISPAEPLGLLGIDLGVELTGTELKFDGLWELAAANQKFPTLLVLPRLHVHKGLPFGIDLGASLSELPSSNIQLIGLEAKYAIMKGNVALPALAARATYSSLQGVDQLDFTSMGLELSISKGLTLLTPYAGVGYVSFDTSTNLPAPAPNFSEKFEDSKIFAGLNMNLGLMNFGLEADKTGDTQSYSLKLGFRF